MLMASCNNINKKRVYLSQPKCVHLNWLSSASGIGIHNQTIYIVGDDVPWLHELDTDLNFIAKTQISAIDTLFEGRTPKHLKADFESAEIISNGSNVELVIISSGSSPNSRDTAYIVDISGTGKIYAKNLRPLYEKIKSKSNLPENREINIEGIAFSENHAYLLHRGNVSENLIIEIDRAGFLGFIKQNRPVPEFEIYRFDLPTYKGVPSGFSGACTNPGNSGLIFTASMEDTKDEINDGKVLGSFVGIIPFSNMAEGEFAASLLLDKSQPLEKKLEGISVSSTMENGGFEVVTVCDNDDGTSDVIMFNMEIR